MDNNSDYRTNIIGAGKVGCAISVDMDENAVHKTNSFFWDTKGNDVLEATVPPLYGAAGLPTLRGLLAESLLILKKTAFLFSVGLTLYTNVLLQKKICLN